MGMGGVEMVPESTDRIEGKGRSQNLRGLSALLAAAFSLALPSADVRAGGSCTDNPDCEDNISCTLNLCVFGTCTYPDQCDDGLFCNGTPTCNMTPPGSCVGGSPPNCSGATPVCHEGLNACTECVTNVHCTNPAEPYCTAQGTCVACLNNAHCNDNLFCNGTETCNTSTGVCVDGADPTCNPGTFCSETFDTCVQCENDEDCNEIDGLFCNGVETCNPTTHTCASGTAVACKTCVGGDFAGWACRTDTECQGPLMSGTCTGATSFCDETYDRCQLCLTDVHCNDFNYCTNNVCVDNAGLRNCQYPNHNLCSDGLHCNGAEVCVNDADCMSFQDAAHCCGPGTPPNCAKKCFLGPTPGATCTVDANCGAGGKCIGMCSETLDGCVECENTTHCNNNLFCDGSETCSAGNVCAAGTPPNCNSLDTDCKDYSCNESTDQCTSVNIANGTLCDDDNHCTAVDQCTNGVCVEKPPSATAAYRCVDLEFRPTTPQTAVVGSIVSVQLYAKANGCNTASTDCPTNGHPIQGLDVLLQWDPLDLELLPSTVANPNPSDPCDNFNSCYHCQTCTGGSTPGAQCYEKCNGGGSAHGRPCNVNSGCAGGVCSGGLTPGAGCTGTLCPGVCSIGGASCTTSDQCPPSATCNGVGTCNPTTGTCGEGAYCSGGSNNGGGCTTSVNCPGGTCVTSFACPGGGVCNPSPPSTYNWGSSLFPNDCEFFDGLNAPCSGFPTNDGNAFYNAFSQLFCGSHPSTLPCATTAGLWITNLKFRVLRRPPSGQVSVSFLPCFGNLSKTKVFSGVLIPPYETNDVTRSLGPPALINVQQCSSSSECNDNDNCTTDACTGGSCVFTPLNCADLDPCTIDGCNNGTCFHNPIVCGAGEVCYQAECFKACSSAAQCGDGVACTIDTCDTSPPPPIDGICRHAESDAFCATGLFCQQMVCDSVLDCVAAPCLPTSAPNIGNPCLNPTDCNESTDTCAGCLPPLVSGSGSRYLTIQPVVPASPNQSTPIAIKVRGHCDDERIDCVDHYVQSMNQVELIEGSGIFVPVGVLGPTPMFRRADLPAPNGWGSFYLTGAEIRPLATYRIIAECDYSGANAFSAAAQTTTRTWANTFIDAATPDAIDFQDIGVLVSAFKGLYSADVTFPACDLWGCSPDGSISFLDISACVDAFKGVPFEGGTFKHGTFSPLCPGVCPP